jgi:fructokinase
MTLDHPPRPSRTLCLGEALVDLICEQPVESVGEAPAFVPHAGGAVANVAVVMARAGVPVALAGGVGDDAWGVWLRDKLAREGIDLALFDLVPGTRTPLAITTLDDRAEATYQVYGEGPGTVIPALGDRLESAVRDSAAVFFGSNTLVGAEERGLTMRARELALEHDRHVIFDPNFRLHRWTSHADAQASANACVPGALLVRANHAEATLMTGEEDAERAATALLKGGARMVVLTFGGRGAILRGELRADARGVQAHVISTIGAGDVLTGTLLARLAQSDFYPSTVAASLRQAVTEAAKACERWGALD